MSDVGEGVLRVLGKTPVCCYSQLYNVIQETCVCH